MHFARMSVAVFCIRYSYTDDRGDRPHSESFNFYYNGPLTVGETFSILPDSFITEMREIERAHQPDLLDEIERDAE